MFKVNFGMLLFFYVTWSRKWWKKRQRFCGQTVMLYCWVDHFFYCWVDHFYNSNWLSSVVGIWYYTRSKVSDHGIWLDIQWIIYHPVGMFIAGCNLLWIFHTVVKFSTKISITTKTLSCPLNNISFPIFLLHTNGY